MSAEVTTWVAPEVVEVLSGDHVDGRGGLGDGLRLLRDRRHLEIEELLEAHLLEILGRLGGRLGLRGGDQGREREAQQHNGGGMAPWMKWPSAPHDSKAIQRTSAPLVI